MTSCVLLIYTVTSNLFITKAAGVVSTQYVVPQLKLLIACHKGGAFLLPPRQQLGNA